MKRKLIILITLILSFSGEVGLTQDMNAQVTKIIKTVGKKGVKKVMKAGAKEGAEDVLKRTGAMVTRRFISDGSRKSFQKILKSKGYKSFLSYSQQESKQILRRGSKSQSPAAVKKGFKDTFKASLKKEVKSKRFKRMVASNVAHTTIPAAAKSLKVRWDRNKRGYVPTFDSKNLSPMVAKKLLGERRKAISPFNQFPTKDQLKKYDKEIIITGKNKDAAILQKNMLKVMDPEVEKQVNAFGGVAAHHLVPGNDPHSKASREILKKFDIDINSPENGIFLPYDSKSIYKGTIHNTAHDAMYSKVVYNRIKDCKSRDELVDAMTALKHDLYNGKIKLKETGHAVNSNF